MAEQTPKQSSNNPGEEHSRRMFSGDSSNLKQQENNSNNDWGGPDTKGPDMKAPEPLKDKEADPSANWANNTTPSGATSSNEQSRRQRITGKMKSFFKRPAGIASVLGVGGLTGIVISAIFLFPNPLKMAIENIMSAAGAIPEYATQQRGEYLATRYLATRILSMTDNDFDSKAIFCVNGSITCSLTSTKFAEVFDKKYGITAKPTVSGAKVTIIPQGRSGLGGKAISWDVEYSRKGSVDGKMRSVTRSITSNNEMLRYIKSDTKRAHPKNYLMRFVAKRIMMKQHGVTHWRALEKQRNAGKIKFAEFKAKIAVNTVGKILPKMPAYFACMEGKNTLACQKTLAAATNAITGAINNIDEKLKSPDLTEDARKKLTGKRAGLTEVAKGISSPDLEGKMGKLISKNVITKAAGPVAIASVIDMVAEVIGGIDNGVLEVVSYDIMSQAYIGLAYGDEVGLVTNVDQMTTEGHDLESLGVLSSVVDGMGESPLYQLRTGQIDYDETKQYTAECDADEGRAVKSLPAGELVCPEEKMVKSYTGFRNDSRWPAVAALAALWNGSVGLVFDLVGAVLGPIVGTAISLIGKTISIIPGVVDLKEYTVEVMSKGIEWIIDSLIGIPDIGPDGSGTASYVALDGGITRAMNDTMQGGIDTETGEVMGAGGRVLSRTEKLAIDTVMLGEERDEFNAKPVMAKLFDNTLRGSMINKLALVMPSNAQSIIGFGPKLLSNVGGILSSNTYAASGAYNPHGFPLYGYGTGDKDVFEAEPTTYTKDFCADSAKAREDSYDIRDGDVLPTYGVTDPCALERIVVGAMLDDAGVTDDENYIKEADSEQMTINATPPSDPNLDDSTDGSGVVIDAPNKNGWSNPTKSATVSFGYHARGSRGLHKALDFPGPRGTPVYAAHDGTVTKVFSLGSVNYKGKMMPCGTGTVITAEGVNGIWHGYQHMDASVKVGDTVKRGQQIGIIGQFCGSGTHLHFSIETANGLSYYSDSGSNDKSKDPTDYLPL